MVENGQEGALTATLVSPVLGAAHAPARNLVYCSAFQLAWNILADRLGGTIDLRPEVALARALNAREATAQDVDAASCVAHAGFVRDGVVEAIAKELDQKFPGHSIVPFSTALPPDAVVAFGYLQRALRYATMFAHAEYGVRFGDANVSSFGVWSEGSADVRARMAQQVVVHDYGGPDDFVIELLSTSVEDRIVVAKCAPGLSLGETTSGVLARLERLAGTPAAVFLPEEYLAIPCIEFALDCEFKELEGRRIANADDVTIDRATQSIRLTFDHKGAVVESVARIVGYGAALGARRFVCDRPFLVLMLRRSSSRPYLAVWVENRELLRTAA